MNILYFFRGLWRELVCFVNKSITFWSEMDNLDRVAVLWTAVGVSGGLWMTYHVAQGELEFYHTLGRGLPDGFGAVHVLLAVPFVIVGVLVVWLPVALAVGAYTFGKHTIKVGR